MLVTVKKEEKDYIDFGDIEFGQAFYFKGGDYYSLGGGFSHVEVAEGLFLKAEAPDNEKGGIAVSLEDGSVLYDVDKEESKVYLPSNIEIIVEK